MSYASAVGSPKQTPTGKGKAAGNMEDRMTVQEQNVLKLSSDVADLSRKMEDNFNQILLQLQSGPSQERSNSASNGIGSASAQATDSAQLDNSSKSNNSNNRYYELEEEDEEDPAEDRGSDDEPMDYATPGIGHAPRETLDESIMLGIYPTTGLLQAQGQKRKQKPKVKNKNPKSKDSGSEGSDLNQLNKDLRRASMYERDPINPLIDPRDDSRYLRNVPAFKPDLERLSLADILSFFRRSKKYEAQHSVTLRLRDYIAQPLIERLYTTVFSPLDANFEFDAFYGLPNTSIRAALLKAILPTNKADWVRMWKSNVKFSPSEEYVNVLNFQQLMDPLLEYIGQARDVYNLLKGAVDAHGNSVVPTLWKNKTQAIRNNRYVSWTMVTLFTNGFSQDAGSLFHTAFNLDDYIPTVKDKGITTFEQYLLAWSHGLAKFNTQCISIVPEVRAILSYNEAYNLFAKKARNATAEASAYASAHVSAVGPPNPPRQDQSDKDLGVCFYKMAGKVCRNGSECKFLHSRSALSQYQRKVAALTFADDNPVKGPIQVQRPTGIKPRLAAVDFPDPPNPDDDQSPEQPEDQEQELPSDECDEFSEEFDAFCFIAATSDRK